MALTTTTTQVSVLTPEIIGRVWAAARGVSVMMPGGIGRASGQICEVQDLRGRGTTVASFPTEDYHTAYDKTEGVDHTTIQSFDPTDQTATVTEKICIEALTDMAVETALESSIARATRMLGVALGEKIDTDVFALNTSLTTDVGSTGAAATFILFSNAMQTLGAARRNGPYLALLHPIQWFDLLNEGTPNIMSATNLMGDQVRRDYNIYGTVLNATVIETARVPTANTAADRSGAVFSTRPPYGLAELWWNRVREQRDESLLGSEIVASACYGVVQRDGADAVAFETDA